MIDLRATWTDTYRDRREAGRVLARELEKYRDGEDTVVLALPRGGVPVAAVIAEELGAPLDLLVVRKLGVPGQEELAMGAIASGGASVRNEEVIGLAGVSEDAVERVAAEERRELERRAERYRGDRPFPALEGKTVLLVDDGIATGSTMKAAIEALEEYGPARIVVAVPVAPPSTVEELRALAEVVCPRTPSALRAIGEWYDDFGQTSDEEVRRLLTEAWEVGSR
jgi:putative phosphoribosyl transferase